jgi:hypothetical protein
MTYAGGLHLADWLHLSENCKRLWIYAPLLQDLDCFFADPIQKPTLLPDGRNIYLQRLSDPCLGIVFKRPQNHVVFAHSGEIVDPAIVGVVLQLSIGVRWAHRSGAERRSMPRAQAANSKSLLMN